MIARRYARWRLIGALLLWAAAPMGSFLMTGIATADDEPLLMRRVFAPHDRVKDWPFNGQRFLPVDGKELERLVQVARSADRGAEAPAPVRVARGRYEARFVGSRLTGGVAELDIEHQGKGPAMLSLAPCKLALGEATWKGKRPQKPILGSDSDGALRVLVEASGRLAFPWTLQGRRQTGSTVRFSLSLPTSAGNELVLDLPVDMVPRCPHGITLQEGTAADKSRRRWLIRLGAQNVTTLVIAPASATTPSDRLTLVRQSSNYRVSSRGVTLETRLTLDIHDHAIHRIVVASDPALRIVEARYGTSDVPWVEVVDPKTQQRRVELHPTEPIQGTDRVVTLRAMAPLPEKFQQPWTLPRLRPQGMSWQEGRATVAVLAPLSLLTIEPTGGRLTPSLSVDSVSLEFFQLNAAVKLSVTHPRRRMTISTATTFKLGGGEIAGRSIALVRARSGHLFELSATVPEHWIIDEVGPDEAVKRWELSTLKRQGGKTLSRSLKVELRHGLTPQRPLKLIVSARARRSLVDRGSSIDALRLFSLPEAKVSRALVVLRPTPKFRLQLTGDERLERLDPQGLVAEDLRLFDQPPTGLVFLDNAQSLALRVSLKPQTPDYTAKVDVEVKVQAGELVESYQFDCTPQSSPIDRLLVHFSPSQVGNLKWSVANGRTNQLQIQQLLRTEQSARGLGFSGETWRVTFRKPYTKPFRLLATRHRPLGKEATTGPVSVALAALPEATSQTGKLVIRRSDRHPLVIDNHRLESIPSPTSEASERQGVQASFRYSPSREAPAADAAVTISLRQQRAMQESAWVWSSQLDSRLSRSGDQSQQMTYKIQNTGRTRISVSLPPDAQLRWVTVDGRQVEPLVDSAENSSQRQHLSIRLPAEQRFCLVVLQYTLQVGPLRLARSVAPAAAVIDMPELHRRWTLWLPNAYEIVDQDARLRRPQIAPLSWSHRLLGPLGRDVAQRRFDPLQLSDWEGAIRGTPEFRAAETRTTRWLRNLSIHANHGHEWGQLLAASLSDEAESSMPIWVGTGALADRGILPQTPILIAPDVAATPEAAELLRDAGLIVLVLPQGAVLTTSETLAWHRTSCIPLRQDVAYWVAEGSLRNHLVAAASAGDHAMLATVDVWRTAPWHELTPWETLAKAPDVQRDLQGWSAYTFVLDDADRAVTPRVVHVSGMRALGWAVMLITAIIAWRYGMQHRMMLALVLAVCAAIAIIVPAAFAPVTSGVCLGIFLAFLMHVAGLLVWPRGSVASTSKVPATDPASTEIRNPLPTPIGMWILGLATALATTAGRTVADENATPKVGPEIHRIIVPVDDQRRPVGKWVHVHDHLYTELQRRAARATLAPRGWLLTGAVYEGAIKWDATAARATGVQLTVDYDLSTFSAATEIRLPLSSPNKGVTIRSATLDGRRVELRLSADEKELRLVVDQSGPHRVQIELHSKVAEISAEPPRTGFVLAIPRLATSRLELKTPTKVNAFEVSSSVGEVRLDGKVGRLTARLGPTSRLAVNWPSGGARRAPAPEFDVDQYLWLKLRPGTVVVDAQFHLNVTRGRLKHLKVIADPRLRYLGARTDATDDPSGGGTSSVRTITIPLRNAVTGEAVVKASFLLRGASGIGDLTLPQLDVIGAESRRRYVAASLQDGLRATKQTINEAVLIDGDDFLARWSGGGDPPTLAHRLRGDRPQWSVRVQPQRSRITADETVLLGFDRIKTQIQYDVKMSTVGGKQIQYRLRIPKTLRVANVTAWENDSPRAARWTDDGDGRLTVFLVGPVTAPQRISIHGEMATSNALRWDQNMLSLLGVKATTRQYQISRHEDVNVEIVRHDGLQETNADAPTKKSAKNRPGGRVAFVYQSTKKSSILQVKVSPNQPKVVARQITRVIRRGEVWQAELRYVIDQVDDGIVDHLRFDVPLNWSAPIEVNPSAQVQLIDLPGLKRRRLVVRPHEPIRGPWTVTLRGTLKVTPPQKVAAPHFTPLGTAKVTHYLILPTKVGSQEIRWDPVGLEAATLPPDLASESESPKYANVYLVKDPRFQAVRKAVRQVAESPLVQLADIMVAWRESGACHGVATFDLQPFGISKCHLRMPPDHTIVRVTVAGVPVTLMADATGRFEIPLGPTNLPQRIVVMFQGALDDSALSRREIKAPVLDGIPVERTLWTTVGPESLSASGTHEDEHIVSPLRQSQIRLRSVADLVEGATEMAAEGSPEDVTNWYRPWLARLLASHDSVLRHQFGTASDESRQEAVEEADQIQTEQEEVARRLGASDMRTRMLLQTSVVRDADTLWRKNLAGDGVTTHRMFPGGQSTLELPDPRHRTSDFGERTLIALLLLAAAGLGAWLVRRSGPIDLLVRWPHATGVAVGLAWWLWLTPSWAGWILVAVSLVVGFFPRWLASRFQYQV